MKKKRGKLFGNSGISYKKKKIKKKKYQRKEK